jgi:hypothetical protein
MTQNLLFSLKPKKPKIKEKWVAYDIKMKKAKIEGKSKGDYTQN